MNRNATIADFIDAKTKTSSKERALNPNSEPSGRRIRKIVISTNIAETSLTIKDVVYVIDSGKMRERQFDPARGISAIVETWISKVPRLQSSIEQQS